MKYINICRVLCPSVPTQVPTLIVNMLQSLAVCCSNSEPSLMV